MQDKTLLALMTIGAVVLVLLWRAGEWELIVLWIVIFFGILIIYTALQAMESTAQTRFSRASKLK
jgi:hypothetical protein